MRIVAAEHIAKLPLDYVDSFGSGKSTLASFIARFFDVKSGSIKIGGVDICDIPKEKLMQTLSFVFQDSKLIKASIADNVKMGKPDATDEEVAAMLKAAQCEDIIEKMPDGVNTVIGSQGVFLSGGERQRISIARAFLKDAPIILLDEATASLDVENEISIQTALSRLIKNKTVLLIAHCMRICNPTAVSGRFNNSRKRIKEKNKLRNINGVCFCVVETIGLEPTTYTLRTYRSTG